MRTSKIKLVDQTWSSWIVVAALIIGAIISHLITADRFERAIKNIVALHNVVETDARIINGVSMQLINCNEFIIDSYKDLSRKGELNAIKNRSNNSGSNRKHKTVK